MDEILRIFSYAEKYRKKMYTSIVYLGISVLMGVVPYFIVQRIIMGFIGQETVPLPYLLIMSAVIFISLFLKMYTHFKGLDLSHQLAYDTLMGMRNRLADKLLKMPMGAINKRGPGGLKKNFVDNIEDMELILAHAMPEGISNLLVLVIVSIILFVLDWRMALLTLAVAPIGMTAVALMMKTSLKKMESYYQSAKEMNENVIEYITGMEVIKVFNQTTSSFKKYNTSVEKYKTFTLDWFKLSWNYMVIYGTILPSTLLFLLPVGVLFYTSGTLTIGTMVLCILLAMSMGLPLARIVEFFPTFPMLKQKAQKIEEVFTEVEIEPGDVNITPSNHTVSFNNVTFAYEDKDVLKNISFTARNNTVTALVGESGAGKSTVAKLLVRFWDIKEGTIKIGDVDIRDMKFETLMNSISYVSQDIFLFNTTIMENIRMGRPGAGDTEVIEMAKIAQCHDFIMEMEHGYATPAGDAGDKLSGGQKQRIAIARAMLKNAPIVVLDEATSFTDPENEDKIQEALNGLIRGKMLIVIAHRLSTIIDVNNIIVLDNGEVSAQGTHAELLDNSPIYRAMWQAHAETMDWDISVKEAN